MQYTKRYIFQALEKHLKFVQKDVSKISVKLLKSNMQKIDSPKESKKRGYKTTTIKILKADNTQIEHKY